MSSAICKAAPQFCPKARSERWVIDVVALWGRALTHVRYAPLATEFLRQCSMSRWAIRGVNAVQQKASASSALVRGSTEVTHVNLRADLHGTGIRRSKC